MGAFWWFLRNYRTWEWRPDLPAVAVGGLVFCVWFLFDYFTGGHAVRSMPIALEQAPPVVRITWIAFRVVGGVVVAPIAEESAYRGFLMRWLISRAFESVSWRHFSASYFCFVHRIRAAARTALACRDRRRYPLCSDASSTGANRRCSRRACHSQRLDRRLGAYRRRLAFVVSCLPRSERSKPSICFLTLLSEVATHLRTLPSLRTCLLVKQWDRASR